MQCACMHIWFLWSCLSLFVYVRFAKMRRWVCALLGEWWWGLAHPCVLWHRLVWLSGINMTDREGVGECAEAEGLGLSASSDMHRGDRTYISVTRDEGIGTLAGRPGL